MSDIVIQVDHLWKKYRLGVLGTGTLRHDFNRWLHRLAGKPDPYARVGEGPAKIEDRSSKIADASLQSPNSNLPSPTAGASGVTVRTIVRYYKLGMSPEGIAAEYPHLSLAQVYGALAYYHANRDEMDLHLAAEEAESDRIEQEHLRLQKRGA